MDLIKLDINNFKEALDKYPVLFVKFGATWCGYCSTYHEHLEEYAEELNFAVGYVQLDEGNDDLAGEYEVSDIPVNVLFINGQFVGKLMGSPTKKRIVRFVEGALDANI